MSKPLNFTASVIFTAVLLLAGAVVASAFDEVEKNPAETPANIPAESTKPDIAATGLSIELSGVRSTSGKLLVMVFDDAKAFKRYDYAKAAGYQEVDAQHGKTVVEFSTLSDGPYAVFAMHDENGDYDLNEQDGYPTEGFVISGAKSSYDEPSFKQAAVASGVHKLELVYF